MRRNPTNHLQSTVHLPWTGAGDKGLLRLIFCLLGLVLFFFESQSSSFSLIPLKSPVHQRSPVTAPRARTPLGEEISSKSSDNLVTVRVISAAREGEEILAAEISEKEEEEK